MIPALPDLTLSPSDPAPSTARTLLSGTAIFPSVLEATPVEFAKEDPAAPEPVLLGDAPMSEEPGNPPVPPELESRDATEPRPGKALPVAVSFTGTTLPNLGQDDVDPARAIVTPRNTAEPSQPVSGKPQEGSTITWDRPAKADATNAASLPIAPSPMATRDALTSSSIAKEPVPLERPLVHRGESKVAPTLPEKRTERPALAPDEPRQVGQGSRSEPTAQLPEARTAVFAKGEVKQPASDEMSPKHATDRAVSTVPDNSQPIPPVRAGEARPSTVKESRAPGQHVTLDTGQASIGEPTTIPNPEQRIVSRDIAAPKVPADRVPKPDQKPVTTPFVLPPLTRGEKPAPSATAPEQLLHPTSMSNLSGSPAPQTGALPQQSLQTPQPVSPAPEMRPAVQSSPQIETTVGQLIEAREAGRAARPELTLRHQEFGAVNMRIEATGSDLRATLTSRDVGFVPAVQVAMAERAVSTSGDSQSNSAQRGQEQNPAQSNSSGSSSGGASDRGYGSSTGSGQASSQPYQEQSRGNKEEPLAEKRSVETETGEMDRNGGGLFA